MPVYIYALHCPIAKTVRYIGKSINPKERYDQHIYCASAGKTDHHTARWIRKLIRAGMTPTMEILEELPDGEAWEEYERFYIQHGDYFGWKLTNTNPGGEGGGFLRQEDHYQWRLKVRAGFTQEVRDHISKKVKEAVNNPRTKAMQRAATKKRWEDPEYRKAMADMTARVNADPETSKRRSEAGRYRYQDPAARKLSSEKLKAFYATEEGKESKLKAVNKPGRIEKARSAQRKNWEDPEYRSSIIAAKTTPEVIEKQRVAAQAQHADPAMKEKMRNGQIAAWQRRKADNPGRNPEEQAIWKAERLAVRRQQRLSESPEAREYRLAKRREQRKIAALANQAQPI